MLIAITLALLLFALSAAPPAPASEPAAEGSQEITVCVRPVGRFFIEAQDGSWFGFEHDILAAFASSQKARLRMIHVPDFRSIFEYLDRGQCDIAAARITYTPEREQIVDFSTPYFPVRVVAVEKAGTATARPSAFQGRTAASIRGSTYPAAIASVGEDVAILWVDTTQEMFEAVEQGRADFLACDSAVVLSLLGDYPSLQISVPLSEKAELAFALSKDSLWTEPLTKHMNRWSAEGKTRELLVRYFGEETTRLILSEP